MQVHKFKAGSAEWLDFRTNFITGTEVASLFGLDKHKSAARVLREKQEPPMKIDNAFLRSGRILEPGVVLLMNEVGIPAEPAGEFGEVVYITHDSHKIGSSMDAKLNAEDGFYVVECKTTQMHKLQAWVKEPPINYLLQVQTQLLATGIKKALLGCMAPAFVNVYKTQALDFFLLVFEVEADERIHNLIVKEVGRFWECAATEDKYTFNKDNRAYIESIAKDKVNIIFQDNRIEVQ